MAFNDFKESQLLSQTDHDVAQAYVVWAYYFSVFI